jgi:hypothetical protein
MDAMTEKPHWITFADLSDKYQLKFDRVNNLCRTGVWPRGFVWQKLADGKTGKKLFRSEAIDLWLAVGHDPKAWERCVESFVLNLPSNQPKKRSRNRVANL